MEVHNQDVVGSVSPIPPPWLRDGHLVPASPRGLTFVRVCVLVSYKDIHHVGLGLTLTSWVLLHKLFKDTISSPLSYLGVRTFEC